MRSTSRIKRFRTTHVARWLGTPASVASHQRRTVFCLDPRDFRRWTGGARYQKIDHPPMSPFASGAVTAPAERSNPDLPSATWPRRCRSRSGENFASRRDAASFLSIAIEGYPAGARHKGMSGLRRNAQPFLDAIIRVGRCPSEPSLPKTVGGQEMRALKRWPQRRAPRRCPSGSRLPLRLPVAEEATKSSASCHRLLPHFTRCQALKDVRREQGGVIGLRSCSRAEGTWTSKRLAG